MKRRRLLSQKALEKLRPLLNYINVSSGSGSELADFYKNHQVPTKIYIERPDGSIVATKDSDRKAILLARVIRYLETGVMPLLKPIMHIKPLIILNGPILMICRKLNKQVINCQRVSGEKRFVQQKHVRH